MNTELGHLVISFLQQAFPECVGGTEFIMLSAVSSKRNITPTFRSLSFPELKTEMRANPHNLVDHEGHTCRVNRVSGHTQKFVKLVLAGRSRHDARSRKRRVSQTEWRRKA